MASSREPTSPEQKDEQADADICLRNLRAYFQRWEDGVYVGMNHLADEFSTLDALCSGGALPGDWHPKPPASAKPIPPATIIGYYRHDTELDVWHVYGQTKVFLRTQDFKPFGAYEPLPEEDRIKPG